MRQIKREKDTHKNTHKNAHIQNRVIDMYRVVSTSLTKLLWDINRLFSEITGEDNLAVFYLLRECEVS